MFNCIKTGFYAITPSLHYLYGDAFGLPGADWPDEAIARPDAYLLLRITSMSSEKPERVHINLRTWSHWFEERAGDILSPAPDLAIVWRPCSTLIASPGQWSWLGYDGEEA
jgi:hypothetical protein